MNNLLDIALSALPKTKAKWYQFDKLEADDRGREVASYKDPVSIVGSFQAVSMQAKKELGLDIARDYKVFYTSNNVDVAQKNKANDYLTIGEDRYDVIDNNDWYEINGWRGLLCIKQI